MIWWFIAKMWGGVFFGVPSPPACLSVSKLRRLGNFLIHPLATWLHSWPTLCHRGRSTSGCHESSERGWDQPCFRIITSVVTNGGGWETRTAEQKQTKIILLEWYKGLLTLCFDMNVCCGVFQHALQTKPSGYWLTHSEMLGFLRGDFLQFFLTFQIKFQGWPWWFVESAFHWSQHSGV